MREKPSKGVTYLLIVLILVIGLVVIATVISKVVILKLVAPVVPSPPTTYSCPSSEWVDCMPHVGGPPDPQCSQDYLNWAKAHCDNFKGAAY